MAIQDQSRMTNYKAATCGGFSGILTEIVFYGLDSYKVMSQAGQKIQISRLLKGALPVACIGSGPSFATFFLLYSPAKDRCNEIFKNNPSVAVAVASAFAAVPSSIVCVPSDYIKKRIVLGEEKTISGAIRSAIEYKGVRGLFVGWQANLIKDVPFAFMKMSLFEGFSRMYLTIPSANGKSSSVLTPLESGGIGLCSGIVTAFITCPLDVVNTRIKSGELANFSIFQAHQEVVVRSGVTALFRGLIPRSIIAGVGSTLFWYLFATLSEQLNKFD